MNVLRSIFFRYWIVWFSIGLFSISIFALQLIPFTVSPDSFSSNDTGIFIPLVLNADDGGGGSDGGCCGGGGDSGSGAGGGDTGGGGVDQGSQGGFVPYQPVPQCPSGYSGTYPNCVPPPQCPAGYTGTYPNCFPPQVRPAGVLDAADCVALEGWAVDLNTPSQSISVHVYFDGPSGPGTVFGGAILADQSRPDVNAHLGITGNHGFRFLIPAQFKTGQAQTVRVYAIDSEIANTNNTLTSGSPKTFETSNCVPPPQCPAGHTGTYPNCVPPQCPAGQTGTYPNCVTPQCPTGYTGTYPNCVPPQCPTGYTGTYPNCVPPPCPAGYTGTYPNCVPPPTSSTGCIQVVKETFNTNNNPMTPVAQFTFRLDGIVQTAYNDSNGNAQFNNVTPGLHTVTEITPSGWTLLSTTPSGGLVNVAAGTQCSTVVFKNKQVIEQSQAPICTLNANPTSISYGGSSTLTWTSQNATSANLSNAGSVGVNGSMTVNPQTTTSYILTVYNPQGQYAICNATINVNSTPYYPPPVYQPPVYQPPTYQPPVYQPPVYQPPLYQLPTYQQPIVYPPSTQYSSIPLSSIPYTGHSNPAGNIIFFSLVVAGALSGAYLLLYWRGGARNLLHDLGVLQSPSLA